MTMEAIKKALEGVTPGPWGYVASNENHGPYVCNDWGAGDICDGYVMSNPDSLSVRNGGNSRPINHQHDEADANMRYIAAVNPAAISELLSTLESLQRENEALKNLIDGDNCADPDKIDALFRRAEAAEAEVARLQAEIDRTERNRDMWKGQVERQAESLSKFREEEIRLRETLFKCGSFIADRYQEGDPEYQVVLLVNSAICGKPALASAGGLS